MWDEILKAKAGPAKLKFAMRYGLTNEWQSTEQVIFRMRETGKRTAGDFSKGTAIAVFKKLVREGKAEMKDSSHVQESDGKTRHDYEWKLASDIVKAEWKSKVDAMVSKDTPFEQIYKRLADELKFHTPSMKEVGQYLKDNYQKHKLWSNLWSKKDSISKAKAKAVETKRYQVYSKFIKKVLKDEGGAFGMQGFIDAGNKLEGFSERYLKYVISDAIDHDNWLGQLKDGDYYLKGDKE